MPVSEIIIIAFLFFAGAALYASVGHGGASSYLAIGPNDPRARILQTDESLPVANLTLSIDQLVAVLAAAAEVR